MNYNDLLLGLLEAVIFFGMFAAYGKFLAVILPKIWGKEIK
jgi:hypothetical protein